MIHRSAIISDSALIADEVEIGPFCVVGDGVEIATGTRIDSHVVVNGPTRIGEDNHIYQFSSIGDDPQDKKYAGEPTTLEIGARNTIREYCTISRGTVQDRGLTTLGDDNWIMAYAHIAHDCVVGSNIIFANNVTLAGHVHVGDWAIMAGFSGAHQFVHVGAHSFIGMYAGTGQDVAAYTLIAGQPPAPRGINSEGLKRRDFSEEQIRNIKNAFKIVFRQGLKLNDAIKELDALRDAQPELCLFIDSLQASDRGLLR